MSRFLICLLASFVCLSAAQQNSTNSTDGWGGCVFPSNPEKPTEVKIGQPTPVCITVGPGGSWAAGVPYVRWVFTPIADQYSYFRIPDCKSNVLELIKDEFRSILTTSDYIHTLAFQQIVNGNGTFQDRNLTVFTASQDM
jgi:hypothetical protein